MKTAVIACMAQYLRKQSAWLTAWRSWHTWHTVTRRLLFSCATLSFLACGLFCPLAFAENGIQNGAPLAEDTAQILARDPHNVDALRAMALQARANGNVELALTWYDKLIDEAPLRAEFRSERAALFVEAGLLLRAVDDMKTASTIAPRHADILNNYGVILRMVQKKCDAEKKAAGETLGGVVLDALDSVGNSVGNSKEDSSPREQAFALFSRAIDIDSGHALAHRNRAQMWAESGNYVEALADIRAGLHAAPWHIGLNTALLYCHAALGNFADAAKALETLYAAAPAHAAVLNECAWFLATCPDKSVQNPARALRYCEELFGIFERPDAAYFDTYAAALAANGDFAGAVEKQERALFMAKNRQYDAVLQEEWLERLLLYHAGKAYTVTKYSLPDM